MSLPSNLRVSNSSYLIVPHSEDFNFGSDDFTIELWIKFNSWLNDRGIVTKGWPSHNGAFLIYATSDSRVAFYASNDGSSWNIANNQTMASGITLNTWYHIAVTRSGSTFRTFVNGSLTSSWSNGSALVNNISKNLAIGNGDTGQHPIDGWIDGLRITKGTARYTSTFVPSSLDHPIESSFKDGSRFNKPVSNKGPTTISSANSQFGGSSGYFDGSSYLSVPGDKSWQLGTEDFTVEAWINPDTVTNTRSIVGNYDGADGGWRLAVGSPIGGTPSYGPEVSFTATNYGTEVDVIIPGVLELTRNNQQGIYNSAVEGSYSRYSSPANTSWNDNGWSNICLYSTRSYYDWLTALYNVGRNPGNSPGVEMIMKHNPTNRYWLIKFTNWQAGAQGGAFAYTRKEILGCTTDTSLIQFRNGNSTVIEKSITPPLASGTWYHLAATRNDNNFRLFLDGNEIGGPVPDPNYANVSLLLHMTGSNGSTSFVDSSSTPKTISVNGNAQISTTQSKFDGSSAYFDGNGDYLTIPASSDWDFGTGDFTIETWVYLLSQGYPQPSIGYSHFFSIINQNTFSFKSYNEAYYLFANNNTQVTTSVGPTLNAWQHIALVRNGTSLKIFVNGIESGSATIDASTSYGANGTAYIGSGWSGEFLHGYIDEFRVTKGVARYNSNFTPSTVPFFPNALTFSDNISRVNSNGLTVGASRSSSNSVTDYYKGYIDDLRVTKGIARYTTNFTKPAAPAPVLGPAPTAPSSPSSLAVTERDNIFKVSLTPPNNDGRSPITSYNFQYSEDGSTWNNVSVVSDPYYDKVSLLLPMTGPNNSFNIFDDSKYNHNISIVGDTKISTAQSWFNNGSALFDGSNDNLIIENNAAFDLRNQDWTIEGWIRPTGDWSKYNTIISKRGNGGGEGTDGDWQLYLRQSNGVLSFYPGTIGGQESGAVPYANVWNHVAAVRNGKVITLYLNGISVLSFVADTLYTTNRKVYVGGWPAGNEYFYGHMNDIRVTKGVARYTSNFDPRTLPQAPANRVTGLSTVGTPYIFRARSVNVVGTSQYSTSTSSPITTLNAPSNFNVIPDSDKAYLSWTAPTPNNSAIRDYSVQYSSDNGITWTTYVHNASISTSIVVDGLTIGTSYSFRVAAVNMAGIGTYVSSASPALTALREDNTYNKTRLLLHLDSN